MYLTKQISKKQATKYNGDKKHGTRHKLPKGIRGASSKRVRDYGASLFPELEYDDAELIGLRCQVAREVYREL